MRTLGKSLGAGYLLAGCLLLSAAALHARDISYVPWRGEPPAPEAGARILAVYQIGGKDVPVWSRMPRRPYRVLGVLRSFETVGLSHHPFYRLAQEAHRRGGDAIAVLAPRHLPASWIRGDDVGVTLHGERFTVLVLRSASGMLLPKARGPIAGRSGSPTSSLDDPS
ncbi:hypothetical protein [Methylacidimicrobium sp. B4]|uniref:hypothetical protein n=1 Tax=Methylacidimicrobium sp. B4 TaxID=2796139 RepID=UPI001A8EC03D|nr:hypothetical protein [Methylacidimicrobium sp. B4]QSR85113.1 hypothetical protein MacB4_02255 [Methylacidimicrobium sp. B4]